ncbi:MAG: hypothetical protein IPO87_06435 [Flavobacteriales bacterium]|nr:hypothetical protein [Flavobacteriales bacterium]
MVHAEVLLGDRYELRNALGQPFMQDRVQGSTTDLDMDRTRFRSQYPAAVERPEFDQTFTINVTR